MTTTIVQTLKKYVSLLALILFISPANAAETFDNPILSGFHPDPSIVRVNDDYYLVNSSFEWFPGIPIYHSKDLVNWTLIGYGIHRSTQLNLQDGMGDYKGVFAVTIRHHEDLFYLITTCVECETGGNFYITAKDPAGPWSDPAWLDAPGIDPSLMWDDDGKAYYVGHGNLSGGQAWPGQQGVWLQELDTEKGKLVGKRQQLTFGHANNAVWTEGPHLYKIDGQYMLMVAEGGTGFNHSVTVHHSSDIWGPYIANQVNPVLSHRQLGRDYPIHSVGHADLVQTQKGDWWSVMLGKRYVAGYSLLARETFLTPVQFQDQTPVFNPGHGKVLLQQERPNLPWTPTATPPSLDQFKQKNLALEWNFLRTPHTKWYDLDGQRLSLNLRRQSLSELSNPSLIARRIESHRFSATLSLDFKTTNKNEHAGMSLYRTSKCHYLLVKEAGDIVIIKTEAGERTEVARTPYKNKDVVLRAEGNGLELKFSFGETANKLKPIGGVQSLSVISFEAAGGFSGPFVGMYASSNGKASKNKAAFDWFKYEEE